MKKVKLNPFLLFPNRSKLHIFMVLMLLYLLFTTSEIKTFSLFQFLQWGNIRIMIWWL